MSEIRVDTISEKTSGSGTTVSSLVNPNSQFRNLIINGDMKIAQRATGATAITNNSVHYATVDRFAVYESSGGVLTSEQHNMSAADQATTGQSKAMELNVTTADTSIASGEWCFFTQSVEAQFCQSALYGTSAAKNLTLSFWVKTNKTGTYAVAIDKNDSTRYRLPITYTVDSANTWEKKVINISPTAGSTSLITAANGGIDDNNGIGFFIWWVLAAGTDSQGTNNTWTTSGHYTTSSQVNWLDSTDNNFHITGVQLEVGSTATDFEYLPNDVNLKRCQRYLQQFGNSKIPGIDQTTGGDRLATCMRGDNNSTTLYADIPLLVPLRNTPTVSFNAMNIRQDATNYDISSFDQVHNYGGILYFVITASANLNVGTAAMLRFTGSDGYIRMDAEL